MATKSEIGRELKVSGLKIKTVIVAWKEGRPAATFWVVKITDDFLFLYQGVTQITLILRRCGPDKEQIEDDDGDRFPMKLYEYLGEI